MFIIYCGFSKIFDNSLGPGPSVSVQVCRRHFPGWCQYQLYAGPLARSVIHRSGRFEENDNISRKNTISNEQTVDKSIDIPLCGKESGKSMKFSLVFYEYFNFKQINFHTQTIFFFFGGYLFNFCRYYNGLSPISVFPYLGPSVTHAAWSSSAIFLAMS